MKTLLGLMKLRLMRANRLILQRSRSVCVPQVVEALEQLGEAFEYLFAEASLL